MINLMVFAIIAAIVGGASLYIYKAKKRGVKCIGCPSGAACAKAHTCSGSCAACGGCCPHSRT